MKVLLNTLFKSPGLCIFRREMNALVSLSNICDSEEDKRYLGEALCCGLSICRDMADLDLNFGVSVKQEHAFTSKGVTMDKELSLLLPLVR